MKEDIPKIKEMMRELTRIKDKFDSDVSKDIVDKIIFDLKELTELMDF